MEKRFSEWKRQSQKRLDLSRKGSIDEAICHVVELLNQHEEFFSTSSCSGRIILIDNAPGSNVVRKHKCVWLFVTHQKCCSDEVMSSLERSVGDTAFKFEPCVLHIQCRTLEDAQLLLSVAVNSGFKNSGMTVSKTGKIVTAVRSTHSLQIPLSHNGKLMVEQEYIDFIIEAANQKMEENMKRIQRLYENLRSALQKGKVEKPSPLSSYHGCHRRGGKGHDRSTGI